MTMMQINGGELGYQLLLRGQRRTGAKGGDTGKMISGVALSKADEQQVNSPACR